MWLWSLDKWLVGRLAVARVEAIYSVVLPVPLHLRLVTGTESGLFVVFCLFVLLLLAGDLQYDDKKFCSVFQDLPNPKSQNCSVWLMLNSFLLPLIVHSSLHKLFEDQSLTM